MSAVETLLKDRALEQLWAQLFRYDAVKDAYVLDVPDTLTRSEKERMIAGCH